MDEIKKAVDKKYDVPIWCKTNLTVDEAVEYSGISREWIWKMTSHYDCPFVLRLGHRRLVKRRVFDEYIKRFDFIE